MTRIAHIGDVHFGYRQYGLQKRAHDVKTAVGHIIAAIRTMDPAPEAVLWAGDLFDSARPPADAVQFLRDQLALLTIPSYGIDGNHDVADGDWLRICGIEPLDNKTVVIGEAVVGGLNYRRPAEFEDALLDFCDDAPGGRVDIFMCHQALGDIVPIIDTHLTSALLCQYLKTVNCRYVALGDIHDRHEWVTSDIRFVYPGSVEMTKLDEVRENSFTIIDIDKTDVRTTIIPIPARPILEVDIVTEDDMVALFKHTDSEECLAVVRVNNDLKDAIKVIKARLAESDTPLRLSTYSESRDAAEQFEDPEWDRAGGLINLQEIVAKTHKKESDEYQLIIEMLDQPGKTSDILMKYASDKGINLEK